MPASLSARDVVVAFGAKVVLDSVSLAVTPGRRIGVIGPNGVGKSTLLRVLAGELPPDSGDVQLSDTRATVGYVPQVRGDDVAERSVDALARRSGVSRATRAMEQAAADLVDGSLASAERYSDALERWLAVGGDDFEARVHQVADDLDLPRAMLERPIGELSGGEVARVALGAVLLTRADIVLLDEPTNDLDFAGLERLERYVLGRAGGLVVVSHDRAFLERTVNSVLELDEHSRGAQLFEGGWLSYLEERAVARRHAEEDYGEYRRRRDELETRASRQRQWADAGARKAQKKPSDHDTAQRDFRANRTEKQASKVRISERALERLDVVDKPYEGWNLQYRIAETRRSGDVVFALHQAVARRGEFVLGPVELEVRFGDRLAIVGPNGSGKTTLLEMLLGRQALIAGSRWMGPSVVVGELDQGRDDLDPNESLEEGLGRRLEAAGLARSEIRSLLAKFGLGAEHVGRPVATLSPGERTRVGLARFMAEGVNTLVLDEPTNHLDLVAIEQLEQALSTWEGTLVLVTHDRRLLEAVPIDQTIGPSGVSQGSELAR